MWKVDVDQEQKLILIKADEALDIANIRRVFGKLYLDYQNSYSDYDRFVDLSALKRLDMDIETLLDIFKHHRRYRPPTNVRLSCYLPYGAIELTGANASLFRLMAESENIVVHVSAFLDECAQYLGVDRALLDTDAGAAD